MIQANLVLRHMPKVCNYLAAHVTKLLFAGMGIILEKNVLQRTKIFTDTQKRFKFQKAKQNL